MEVAWRLLQVITASTIFLDDGGWFNPTTRLPGRSHPTSSGLCQSHPSHSDGYAAADNWTSERRHASHSAQADHLHAQGQVKIEDFRTSSDGGTFEEWRIVRSRAPSMTSSAAGHMKSAGEMPDYDLENMELKGFADDWDQISVYSTWPEESGNEC